MSHRQLVAGALVTMLAAGVSAQAPEPGDYGTKASYLVGFAHFFTRSIGARRAGSFDLCLIGVNHFGRALNDEAETISIEGRPVDVRQVDSGDGARDCDILFISNSEDAQTGEILQSLEGASVLTVSDMPRFAQRGGMIQFVPVDGHVRFEINLEAAQSAGIVLSPDVLRLASTVHGTPRTGSR